MELFIAFRPADRERCGLLTLRNKHGSILLGPVPVAGRSSDALAARHGNPDRNPLFRYGDAPTGAYRVARIVAGANGNAPSNYGPHGIVVLEAISGDAALAEATGRYYVLIHGGHAGPRGSLRSTSGALRLRDSDQAQLVAVLGSVDDVFCRCVEDPNLGRTPKVSDDKSCLEEDPPLLTSGGGQQLALAVTRLSRRDVLQHAALATMAGGITLSLPVSFLTTRSAHAEQYAQLAYGTDSGSNDTSAPYQASSPYNPNSDGTLRDAPNDASNSDGGATTSGNNVQTINPNGYFNQTNQTSVNGANNPNGANGSAIAGQSFDGNALHPELGPDISTDTVTTNGGVSVNPSTTTVTTNGVAPPITDVTSWRVNQQFRIRQINSAPLPPDPAQRIAEQARRNAAITKISNEPPPPAAR